MVGRWGEGEMGRKGEERRARSENRMIKVRRARSEIAKGRWGEGASGEKFAGSGTLGAGRKLRTCEQAKVRGNQGPEQDFEHLMNLN